MRRAAQFWQRRPFTAVLLSSFDWHTVRAVYSSSVTGGRCVDVVLQGSYEHHDPLPDTLRGPARLLIGCSRALALSVSRLDRFCATACVPGGNTARKLSTRLLTAAPGACATGPEEGAPARQSPHRLLWLNEVRMSVTQHEVA